MTKSCVMLLWQSPVFCFTDNVLCYAELTKPCVLLHWQILFNATLTRSHVRQHLKSFIVQHFTLKSHLLCYSDSEFYAILYWKISFHFSDELSYKNLFGALLITFFIVLHLHSPTVCYNDRFLCSPQLTKSCVMLYWQRFILSYIDRALWFCDIDIVLHFQA